MLIEKCPECGSRQIGQGVFSGYANIAVKGSAFSSSKVIADICSNCGLVISMHVDRPEKFVPNTK